MWRWVPCVVLVVGCREPPALSGGSARAPLVTVFVFDGLRQDRLLEGIEDGALPELGRLVREGALVRNGVSAFPSVTGYAYYPFLTGEDAARSGVLGLRWFDRQRGRGSFRNYVGRTHGRMDEDLAAHPPTVFECFPEVLTSAYDSLVERGAVHTEIGGWAFVMAKYGDHWWLPRVLRRLPWVGDELAPGWIDVERDVLDSAVRQLVERPKVQWIVLTALDAYSHLHGVDAGYDELLRGLDGLVGRYREASRALGQEPERAYAVLSDHGVVSVRHNIDLQGDLRRRTGLRLWRGRATHLVTTELDASLERYDGHDGIIAVNGNTMIYLYLRRPDALGAAAWLRPLTSAELRAYRKSGGSPAVDVIAALAAIPGVELIAARAAAGGVEIAGPAGRGRLRVEGDLLTYEVEGSDPLGYATHPATRALIGAPHTGDVWLRATQDTDFPDGLVRLRRLLAQDSAGDLVVTAREGYDLAHDFELFVGGYRGGHGGLRADQARVAYVLSGYGVRAGAVVDVARAEDVGATLLELAGAPQFPGAAGRILDELLLPPTASAPR